MKINTKYFGEVEIEEKDIVAFDQGIPGFIDEKQFVILPFGDEDTALSILQAVKNSNLAFVITNPFLFFKDYEFNLPDNVTEQLEIKEEKEVAVFVILTVQDPFEKTTANLKAPIVLNIKNSSGKQIVLNDDQYQTRHTLFSQPHTAAKGEN
ncbi:flagellar assembly protein FliW [Pseudalkalibacillus salsuginis]|uniref:flagellar assembly protein FliW n=1 Tax=Pseudalkalibacillus salsuginis TaxID=2910972 RepID=UPI001F307E2C|nr:flagellar assembly protein FliW [Pseudalkalibacillus salsuginis]MCF6410150.1 flagellar assembly protein FliW [Pseudalkalibacillus salsuginis]